MKYGADGEEAGGGGAYRLTEGHRAKSILNIPRIRAAATETNFRPEESRKPPIMGMRKKLMITCNEPIFPSTRWTCTRSFPSLRCKSMRNSVDEVMIKMEAILEAKRTPVMVA